MKPSLGALWSNLINERFKLHRYPENMKKMTEPKNESTISSILRSLKVKISSRIQRNELFYFIDKEGIKGITANI